MPSERIAACFCGQLQARVTGEPIRVSVCHCLNCQRRTGGVFATQARFPAEAVSITGRSSDYTRSGDSGSKATFHFCPACGSTVYYTAEFMPGNVAIPVGAFADPRFPAPTFSVYEERMHAWVHLPDDMDHMS